MDEIRPAVRRALTEPDLFDAVRHGQAWAVAELLRRFETPIRHACRRFAQGMDEHDVVQDTMLQIARRIDQYRGDAAFMTWATAIARSQVHRRRRRVRPSEAPFDELRLTTESAAVDPEHQAANSELRSCLLVALEALPPVDRDIVILRRVHGLTAPEVARRLGLTVPAVKSRLHRALRVLRSELTSQAA